MLVRVLTEPANSLLAQMKLQFAIDGVDLSFSQDALEEIAEMALERKTGARALRSIVEKVHSYDFRRETAKPGGYIGGGLMCLSSEWWRWSAFWLKARSTGEGKGGAAVQRWWWRVTDTIEKKNWRVPVRVLLALFDSGNWQFLEMRSNFIYPSLKPCLGYILDRPEVQSSFEAKYQACNWKRIRKAAHCLRGHRKILWFREQRHYYWKRVNLPLAARASFSEVCCLVLIPRGAA